MVKTKIIETTEKYDDNGKLIEKVTREETSEDDTVYTPIVNTPSWGSGSWGYTCTTTENHPM
mgnify:CR=1 FL=1